MRENFRFVKMISIFRNFKFYFITDNSFLFLPFLRFYLKGICSVLKRFYNIFFVLIYVYSMLYLYIYCKMRICLVSPLSPLGNHFYWRKLSVNSFIWGITKRCEHYLVSDTSKVLFVCDETEISRLADLLVIYVMRMCARDFLLICVTS